MDGVFTMQEYYAKGGFIFSHRNMRFRAKIAGRTAVSQDDNEHIVPLTAVPFEQLLAYDRTCFLARRANFLRGWITQPDALALGCQRSEKLCGYGMVRRCKEGCKIGPLFADDGQAAVALHTHLARFAAGGSLYLDAPENNPAVMVLVAQQPKMMSVGLHGRISGHPARAIALARFLDYVQGHERIWICRWEEIARHWMREHPFWPGKQAGDEGNDR